MSPLASRIYKQLVTHVRRRNPTVTYGELAKSIQVHHRSPQLHVALGEVTNACRHSGLPVIAAMVCRADSGRPSDGYYRAAHPRAQTDEAREAAWMREHAKVIGHADKFPTKLD